MVALLTVKPSRGVVVFFALLVIALAVKTGWSKHEQSVVKRDSPSVTAVRRALRCIAGRDIQRVLGPRAGDGSVTTWRNRLNDRLQQIASALPAPHAETDWPVRCVTLFDRVVELGVPKMDRQHADALAVVSSLRPAVWDHTALLEALDGGDLAESIARLAMQVTGVSMGAMQSWDADLREAPTDLWPVPAMQIPQPAPLDAGMDHAMFVLPDLLAWQSTRDRMLHLTTFNESEGVKADRLVGPGAPIRSAGTRNWMTLAAQDGGDALVLPEGQPATMVLLPPSLRAGAERMEGWDALVTDRWLWLLTEHDGELHLRQMPRAGGGWTDALLGTHTDWLSAVLVPREAKDGVDIAGYERTPRGVRFVREVAAPGMGEVVSETLVAQGKGVDLFAPASSSCASEGVRYVVALSRRTVTVARAESASKGTAQEIAFEFVPPTQPGHEAMEFSCNRNALLLHAHFDAGAVMVLFDFERNLSRVLEGPGHGGRTHVLTSVMTRDRGVVCIAEQGDVVRAWRTRSLMPVADALNDPHDWEGGAMVGVLKDYARYSGAHVTRVGAISAEGNQIALLLEVEIAARHFVARVASHDGGNSFHGGAE